MRRPEKWSGKRRVAGILRQGKSSGNAPGPPVAVLKDSPVKHRDQWDKGGWKLCRQVLHNDPGEDDETQRERVQVRGRRAGRDGRGGGGRRDCVDTAVGCGGWKLCRQVLHNDPGEDDETQRERVQVRGRRAGRDGREEEGEGTVLTQEWTVD